MSVSISVQLDIVQGLADELAGLSACLAADEEVCGSAARTLWSSLEGSAGFRASSTGTAWARVLELLAQRSGAVSATLFAACEAYRRAEAQLAAELTTELEALRGRGPR